MALSRREVPPVVPDTTSTRLLAQARRGDPQALADIVARHLPRLTQWAHGRLPRCARAAVDTADIVHDTILHTLGRLNEFDPRTRGALGAYLRQAARNRMIDERRRIGRRGMPESLSDDVTDAAPSPEEWAILAETEARYRRALAQLRPLDQQLIVAHIELHYTHEQLGCMTGRSPHAARMALRRAIGRLALAMDAS